MATFSERLKEKREAAGLTQPQLAEKVGVSKGAVGNWETGDHVPRREKLRQLAEILNTTELYLSGESEMDLGTFAEETARYDASLPFSRMLPKELEFILESRQQQLNETTDPQKRRELLGVIAEVAGEMQKRIPQENESRTISTGGNREAKPEEKKQ